MKRLSCKIWRYFRYYCMATGWRSYVQEDGGALIEAKFPRGEKWHLPFCADPFLFRHDGVNWLFYETTNAVGKGLLGCFKQVGRKWIQQGVVLEKPWHMSYPQVFEENGHVYMIPEQSDLGRGNVSLYEATKFPYEWECKQVLIDMPFADATLLRHEGYYYLACYMIPPHESAELWCAPSLMGPWTRHPQSANVNQSKRLRRCGGSFIVENGQLYRVAQDCNGTYGKRVYRIPVLKISPVAYEEGDAELLLDRGTWPHAYKHTYNTLSWDERRLVVFDVQWPYFRHVREIVKIIQGRLCSRR